jgi:hypothetical protein
MSSIVLAVYSISKASFVGWPKRKWHLPSMG